MSEFVLKPAPRELAVASSAGTDDRLVREICVGAGTAVVSVAYKPSPDMHHRVAIGQSYAARRWGAKHGLDVDPSLAEKAEAAADFEDVRSRLFGIAYRTLGRAADAEDVVQDVWIRWQGVDRAGIRDRVAFLSIVTTRIALNVVTSARVRREVSLGMNLPERDDAAADPAVEVERGEKLVLAVHILIERLSPVERAVYVLREAFGYSFRDISEAFGLGEANARQLARRARVHLAEERHNPVDPAKRDGLLEAFLDAARAGDMARLISLLTDGIVQSGRSGQIGSRLSVMATG